MTTIKKAKTTKAKAVRLISERLTPTSRKLVNDFDAKAQKHGWESDQGNGAVVDQAKADWEQAKDKLERRILSLEDQLKKYRPSSKRVPPSEWFGSKTF